MSRRNDYLFDKVQQCRNHNIPLILQVLIICLLERNRIIEINRLTQISIYSCKNLWSIALNKFILVLCTFFFLAFIVAWWRPLSRKLVLVVHYHWKSPDDKWKHGKHWFQYSVWKISSFSTCHDVAQAITNDISISCWLQLVVLTTPMTRKIIEYIKLKITLRAYPTIPYFFLH